MAGQETGVEDDDRTVEEAAEPSRMSWFVFLFMTLCLMMTAAMAYYAWQVFQSAV